MLVGETLALQYLDPATIQSGGVVTREQFLARLTGLVGDRDLAKALEPWRKRFDDERIVHEIVRKRVAEAVRRLATLGFIELIDDDHVRLRSPLLRFADPVRGLQEFGVALERLIARGDVVDLSAADERAEVEHGALGAEPNGEEDSDESDSDEDLEVDA
jgi:chromosome partition protein MukE